MRDEEVKNMLNWAKRLGLAKKPKHTFTVAHDNYREYVADCPECDKQIMPNRDWTVADEIAYLPVSFCPRCGTPIDWTGVLGKEELEEVE